MSLDINTISGFELSWLTCAVGGCGQGARAELMMLLATHKARLNSKAHEREMLLMSEKSMLHLHEMQYGKFRDMLSKAVGTVTVTATSAGPLVRGVAALAS